MATDSGRWIVEGVEEHHVPEDTSEYTLVETKEQEGRSACYGDTDGEATTLKVVDPHIEKVKDLDTPRWERFAAVIREC